MAILMRSEPDDLGLGVQRVTNEGRTGKAQLVDTVESFDY